MNRELLLKVADAIEANPEHFDMYDWFENSRCKTTACIAGWAWVLNCGESIPATSIGIKFDATNTRKVLDLTFGQWQSLISSGDWIRKDLSRQYTSTGNVTARAKIAANYVRWFVENAEKTND